MKVNKKDAKKVIAKRAIIRPAAKTATAPVKKKIEGIENIPNPTHKRVMTAEAWRRKQKEKK